MTSPDRSQDDLRIAVARFCEESAVFRDHIEKQRAELLPRAERAGVEREQAMEELRHDFDTGRLPAEDRALGQAC